MEYRLLKDLQAHVAKLSRRAVFVLLMLAYFVLVLGTLLLLAP